MRTCITLVILALTITGCGPEVEKTGEHTETHLVVKHSQSYGVYRVKDDATGYWVYYIPGKAVHAVPITEKGK